MAEEACCARVSWVEWQIESEVDLVEAQHSVELVRTRVRRRSDRTKSRSHRAARASSVTAFTRARPTPSCRASPSVTRAVSWATGSRRVQALLDAYRRRAHQPRWPLDRGMVLGGEGMEGGARLVDGELAGNDVRGGGVPQAHEEPGEPFRVLGARRANDDLLGAAHRRPPCHRPASTVEPLPVAVGLLLSPTRSPARQTELARAFAGVCGSLAPPPCPRPCLLSHGLRSLARRGRYPGGAEGSMPRVVRWYVARMASGWPRGRSNGQQDGPERGQE